VKKILLTGSTGFVGSAILNELSKNYIVYCLNRKKVKQSKKYKNIYFKSYDDLNSKLRKIQVDTVIHCATHYVKYHNIKDINKLSNSNILFGNIILENLAKMKVKKFINFSTVWENYDGIKDNYFNLYSVYKRSFSNLLKYYEKRSSNINFYNLFISDTFGKTDKRPKIINVLKKNYKKNLITKVISSKLYLNLLNIEDIINSISIILKNENKPGQYNLVNNKSFSILQIINAINNKNNKKIKIKWLSNKQIKERIFKNKKLIGWTPKNSTIDDIVGVIKS
jgi:nucleoside-diphosphate-sugar epimerase